ncbi:MAG: DUF721 domain-containing protein [Bacteroidales bacterium]
MRHSKTENVGSLLAQLVKQYNLEGKLLEVKAAKAFETLFGSAVTRHTERVEVQRRTLYVYLRSSVVRNELMMQKTRIVEAVNEKVGASVIDRVVFR